MHELVTFLLMVLPFILFIILIKWFSRMLHHPQKIIPEPNGMMKISSSPSYFGGSSSDADYYYDDHYFYEVKNNNPHKIQLSQIIRVKPGFTKINNRRNWCVTYLIHNQKKEVHFYSNLTLFNHNFAGFLLAVKKANPEAELKKLSLFNL
ncbi:hypothetical protein [Kosakonia sp.]|uniref:hypothetical protein n=1 Tax=Kosakonia sp. TaxID=1916651 RepID=UPI00289D10B7|nr:hypothetical protein [Kosakonia sp.]